VIGPGRLVLVVGPSGAGKDTLIALARARLAGRDDIVFPRRVVTRQVSAFEDHDSASDEEFSRAMAQGAFALTWTAHGLRYGVPASVDADLSAGRTAVCNASRAIIGPARLRYALVTVALVTAPADVLASRLLARSRGTDGPIADRLARTVTGESFAPDVVIENIDTPAIGAARLVAAITSVRTQ
jgi:ribose 1,5-bisphosphokinase